MRKKPLVVAALLLTNLGGNAAAAAENDEHKSKHAQKLIATLNMLGINNSDVVALVEQADSHVDHGYFYLSETNTMGGRLALRYQLGKSPSIRQMELNFAPEDSHVGMYARTNGVRVSYHLEF